MKKSDRIEVGKASSLHFGKASAPLPVHRASGGARRQRGGAGSFGAVLGCFALLIVCFACYWSFFRPISITVNGEPARARVGVVLDDLLKDNDYYSAKPGRLLSVGGNVLDEQGGDRCVVQLDGRDISSADYGLTRIDEGAVLIVGDGADATEEHEEKGEPIAPGVQMESGGAIQFVSQWARPGKRSVWTGKRSGEIVDKGVVESPQDMIIASRNVHPSGEGKYVALTFDDGPGKHTAEILDILKKKGAKATFFNLGSQEAGYGKCAKRLVEEGHELASHTNNHQYLPKLETAALRDEIASAANAIKDETGVAPMMMRAPYGAFTAADWARAGDLISCNVLWNIDTEDWRRPGADSIRAAATRGVRNGSIILMHDGGGDREQDVAALPGIIDDLKAAGYELVTVGELMAKDNSFPKEVVEGKVKMPDGAVLPTA